uniref:Hydroxysteroid dehydrogenase-like protein 2 n=1 Tax=Cynoglossus semilaevis TaxID=244447 RepID=A0A3P8WYW6_CYNSE
MLQNTGKLAGCTLFITGASRGIGKAIALKAARDGANIIIAAKTAEPHPKLPGTIYTAAQEVEAAGGKALPCVVDIRDEKQVTEAVQKAVETFGGIDILVNNASAISLTGTLETPMKKVDLMLGINLRGTYLTSKLVIPHLLKSRCPHILNLSPPLNLNPVWFKNHTAYTMAKYGMSMCVLGMAEEFRGQIAVNALWPKTAIQTAAMDMLGGEGVAKQCRTVDIIADAAYVVLSQPKDYTGHFLVDEDVLKGQGVQDLEQYAVEPGHPLLPDFFLDETPETLVEKMEQHGATPAFKPPSSSATAPSGGPIAGTFSIIKGAINEDVVKSTQGVYEFDLSGKLKPTMAFMSGKLRIKGDMSVAIKLEKLMSRMNKAKL